MPYSSGIMIRSDYYTTQNYSVTYNETSQYDDNEAETSIKIKDVPDTQSLPCLVQPASMQFKRSH